MTPIRPLSEELQRKAEEELNEVSGRIKEDLQQLKNWLEKQPHLNARQDDYFLLSFLRCCKFSIEKVKTRLDYFHSIRTLWPEYFGNRRPMSEEIQRVLVAGAVLPLPKTIDLTGPRIMLIRLGACNPSVTSYQMIITVACMIGDILMQEDDNTVVSGLHVLMDYTNFDSGYLMQLTPNSLYRSINILQMGYPFRMYGIDLIYATKIIDGVFAIVKSALSNKLKERAHAYTKNSISDMYKYLPQNLLPKEYGGNTESVNEIAERWKKKVESYSQWFEEDAKYCSNESLRPQESKDEVFGTNGTFRKLNLD